MGNEFKVNGKVVTDDIATVLESFKGLEGGASVLEDGEVTSGAEANALLNVVNDRVFNQEDITQLMKKNKAFDQQGLVKLAKLFAKEFPNRIRGGFAGVSYSFSLDSSPSAAPTPSSHSPTPIAHSSDVSTPSPVSSTQIRKLMGFAEELGQLGAVFFPLSDFLKRAEQAEFQQEVLVLSNDEAQLLKDLEALLKEYKKILLGPPD